MLYGHIGFALAAKPLSPKVSIGVLLFAANAADILCGVFMIAGIESGNGVNGTLSVPWSHGLFMSVIWSMAGFLITFMITRNSVMSLVVGFLVFSHWILDFISHPMGFGKTFPKDLPLFFNGSLMVGLGLYNSVIAAVISELGLLAAGIVVYLRKTKAIDPVGKWAFIPLIIVMALFPLTISLPAKVMNVSLMFLLVAMPSLGIWIDRHRIYVSGR